MTKDTPESSSPDMRDAVYAMLRPYREPGTNDAAVRAWWQLLVQLVGENQELRQVVMPYRMEHGTCNEEFGRCSMCVRADALLAKPVAPDQPTKEEM